MNGSRLGQLPLVACLSCPLQKLQAQPPAQALYCAAETGKGAGAEGDGLFRAHLVTAVTADALPVVEAQGPAGVRQRSGSASLLTSSAAGAALRNVDWA